MKLTFLKYFFLLLCCVSFSYAQPKIQIVEGTSFEFGDIFTGQRAEHVLTIKNVGKDTLVISEVKASCGCTATMLSEKILAPSQEGKLSIAFNTAQYGNTKVTKQVNITSNDTTNPRITVSFSANVINVLDIIPKIYAFDNSKLDSTYMKVIIIKNPSKKTIKITSVDTKFEYIKLNLLKDELAPGEQTELQAIMHATKPGTFQGSINLTTDSTIQPKFEIKVYAWVNRK